MKVYSHIDPDVKPILARIKNVRAQSYIYTHTNNQLMK